MTIPIRSALAAFLVLSLATTAAADVKLAGVFGPHMVLQRGMSVPVWGRAEAGETVTVTLAGQSKSVTADPHGKWSVRFPSLEAGGPHVLRVQGKTAVEVPDVLVGEVWLCSGQSNMARTVRVIEPPNMKAEIRAACYPRLRMLQVAHKNATTPQDDCAATWQICSPETVGAFSATAYFFGRDLHQALGVPVGLINASLSGTRIEAWTSIEAQRAVSDLRPLVEEYERSVKNYDTAAAEQVYQRQLSRWKGQQSKAKADGKAPLSRPMLPHSPDQLPSGFGVLYNAMIAPAAPYAIRGAIWYQGETNASSKPKIYGRQLKTMIANWRETWQEGDFPFLFVQLPNFREPQREPSEPVGWTLIREQFLQTLRNVPNTGMAVTIDIGQVDNIHPQNKPEVGRRLALWALAKTYGRDLVACGPLYRSMKRAGEKIVIEFDDVDGGLVAKGSDKLRGFVIAGDDKRFVWADARIEGETVVVSSPEVKTPASVRYGWAMNPACNLYNKAGLPASPFRTDDWPGR